ncbi:MAG: Rieske (2Fe-2S) protein [Candidatus Brachytrichaceae bacterium NZ_4S206]|jgi:nitrite reductase/ring-hydroxylating ferredoxin subunit
MKIATSTSVLAARLSELRAKGCLTATVDGHTIALFDYGGKVYAVDNRCPHMGFPLDRGSVRDGILTCHWHHARFDLASGGAFDLWADDVRTFPVEVRGDEIWVSLAPHADPKAHLRQRLRDGLERNLSLVIAKSVIGLAQSDAGAVETFRAGLEFGARYRRAGWGQGLTILTCMMNLLPYLAPEDRSRALYHGLSAVARDTDGMPPRFIVQPLPGITQTRLLGATGFPELKRWFHRFIEVRDVEGAERCIASAVRAGATSQQLADMLFAAATDHRYIDVGHPLDFTNKALEALDIVGWTPENAELVLTSLVNGYANADRMEESNAWRNPIDLVEMLERAFAQLEVFHHEGASSRGMDEPGRQRLVAVLLGDDPQAVVDALLHGLREGVRTVDLAGVVAYAAALRIARFHTSNEFGDWDTALHTFTFANAVHQGLRRLEGFAQTRYHASLLRGIFDAAMSIYLDRFLNVPAARIPSPDVKAHTSLGELPALLDRQQQVDAAGEAVAQLLYSGTPPREVIAMLGKLLLREDRDFHTIQCIEAAVRQHTLLADTPEATHVLIAAARYLAAHAPTMRAQGQTFNIAQRLARGEHLFEG